MNEEQHEHAMDLQFRHAEIEHRTDLYDSVQDARSEARYADDPSAEPTTDEVKDAAYRACVIDESAGEADKFVGGKR